MKIKYVSPESLKEHPKNPRIHPDSEIKQLVAAIKRYGFTNPILVSDDGYIIAGHARKKAAEAEGLDEVPVIELPLSGSDALAYMVADNKLQEFSKWHMPNLQKVMGELKESEFDLDFTGFDDAEIYSILEEEFADTYTVPEGYYDRTIPVYMLRIGGYFVPLCVEEYEMMKKLAIAYFSMTKSYKGFIAWVMKKVEEAQ